MNIDLSCPSKTFVLGEYLVLDERQALVANTRPRFQLSLNSRGSGTCEGIHPNSPAGVWFRKHQQDFKGHSLSFIDPHEGRGGLGASSAQFLMVHYVHSVLAGHRPMLKSTETIQMIWEDFGELQKNAKGRQPSGADIVAQWTGGLSLLKLDDVEVQSLMWPFQRESFFILRTGKKLATHEHLKTLEKFDTTSLSESFSAAKSALIDINPNLFAESVNAYGRGLESLGLQAEESVKLVQAFRDSGLVKAAKACGAMGADMLFIFFDKERVSEIQKLIETMELEIVASHEDLSDGLKVSAEPNREITKGPWT